jgi:hypothetical protein
VASANGPGIGAGSVAGQEVERPLDTDGARRTAESARASCDDLRLPDCYPTVWKVGDKNSSGRARDDLIPVCPRPGDGSGTVPGFVINSDIRCVRESTQMGAITSAHQVVRSRLTASVAWRLPFNGNSEPPGASVPTTPPPIGFEDDADADIAGAVGDAPAQAAAKTQKLMTTYRMG